MQYLTLIKHAPWFQSNDKTKNVGYKAYFWRERAVQGCWGMGVPGTSDHMPQHPTNIYQRCINRLDFWLSPTQGSLQLAALAFMRCRKSQSDLGGRSSKVETTRYTQGLLYITGGYPRPTNSGIFWSFALMPRRPAIKPLFLRGGPGGKVDRPW